MYINQKSNSLENWQGQSRPFLIHKRPKTEEEETTKTHQTESSNNGNINEKLLSILTLFGDENDSVEAVADEIISKKYGINTITFANSLLACVEILPLKIPLYATLVGYVNVKEHESCVELVSQTYKKLAENFNGFEPKNINVTKNLLQFVAGLVNAKVLASADLIVIYNGILDAVELSQSNVVDDNNDALLVKRYNDALISVLLSTLPFCSASLSILAKSELEAVLGRLLSFFANRKAEDLSPLLLPWSSNANAVDEIEDELTWSWEVIYAFVNDCLNNPSVDVTELPVYISKPYLNFKALFASSKLQDLFPPLLAEATEEKQKFIITSSSSKVTNIAKFKDFHLRPIIFIVPKDRLDPQSTNIERWCFRHFYNTSIPYFVNGVSDFINYFTKNVPRGIVDFNCLFLESVLVDIISPMNSCNGASDLLFGSIITKFLFLRPNAAPYLGTIINIIYNEFLPKMNATVLSRYSWWFAYHLSNFDFEWNWLPKWQDCFSKQYQRQRYEFVKQTVNYLIVVSYHENISKVLPKEILDAFLPTLGPEPHSSFDFKAPITTATTTPKKKLEDIISAGDDDDDDDEDKRKKYEDNNNINNNNNNNNNNDNCNANNFAVQLLQKIKAKESFPEIINWLKNLEGSGVNERLKVRIVIQTVLQIGSKSYTHLSKAVTSNLPLLQYILTFETIAIHRAILNEILSFWRNSHQFQNLSIDRFLFSQILDANAAIDYVFDLINALVFGRKKINDDGGDDDEELFVLSDSDFTVSFPFDLLNVILYRLYPDYNQIDNIDNIDNDKENALFDGLQRCFTRFIKLSLPSSSSTTTTYNVEIDDENEKNWRIGVVSDWCGELARKNSKLMPKLISTLELKGHYPSFSPDQRKSVLNSIREFAMKL